MSAQKKAVLASSWSDLPQEIISRIVRRLDSAIDVCRLHSVCKNWHYARNPDHRGLLCPFLPRIITNNNLPFTVRQRDTVILVARTVFLVKPLGNPPPSCGWLLTVEEMVPGKLRILYPLSKNRVKHLPSNFPKFLDLSKYQISQVDKSYGLKYDSDKVDVPDVRRVILCSKSNVMVLYGGGTLIRLSLKKGHWRFVWYSINSPFSDVISYGRNNVRAIDRIGNVHVIDHKAARVVKTISPKSLLYKAGPIMLLRSNEDLYVAACVSRNHGPSGYDLIIYRLDEVKPELIDVSYDSYYRRVLFVSCDWRFFLYEYNLDLRHYFPKPKKQQKEEREKVKGDYVIYAEKSFQSLSWYTKVHLYGTTLGIGVFFFDKDDEEYWVKEPRCTSTTAAVLWPPPAWFWPDTYSSSSDDDEELDIQNHTPCNRKHLLSSCTVDASTSFVPPNKQVSEAKFTAVGSSNTLTIQVTRLKCGGFILTTKQNHAVLDAPGMSQFIHAELVRGAEFPSVHPVWDRHLLCARNPPRVTCMHHEYDDEIDGPPTSILPFNDVVHKIFFFGPTEIGNIRRLLPAGHWKKSTTFEILTACIWRSRTIAMQFNPKVEVRLRFLIHVRHHKLNPPIPKGYYGNLMATPVAISTAQDLISNPLEYTVELIKKVKHSITEEYIMSMVDFLGTKGRPRFHRGACTYYLVDVSRVGLDQWDFGWGKPVYGGPTEVWFGRPTTGFGNYYLAGKNGNGETGILVPMCLPRWAMGRFVEELKSVSISGSSRM